MLTPIAPPFRKRSGKPRAASPAPINRIASVTVQPDLQTIDIVFTPGTAVTAVIAPDDNFFVNYPGGQTTGSVVSILGPTQVQIVLFDVISAPATWEVDSADLFSFAEGAFAGPFGGDVGFE